MIVGSGSGYLAWGHHDALIALTILFPLAWSLANTRAVAFVVAAAYYLAASRGMTIGASVFFGDQVPYGAGVGLWIGSSLLLAIPWAIGWRDRLNSRGWRLPIVLAAISVPPVGLIGWANPLAAGSLLFPGFGWFGVAATILILVVIILRPMVAIPILTIAIAIGCLGDNPSPPDGWRGVDTRLGGARTNSADFIREYENHQQLMRIVRGSPKGEVLVFPELVAGQWNRISADLWEPTLGRLRADGTTIILGAELSAGNRKLENVALILGSQTETLHQRIPVPISMYRPWSESGYQAHLFGRETTTIGAERVAAMICYEQILVWPIVLAMLDRPTVLVGMANAYWARDTSIPTIQRSNLNAWARIFGTRLVMATNY